MVMVTLSDGETMDLDTNKYIIWDPKEKKRLGTKAACLEVYKQIHIPDGTQIQFVSCDALPVATDKHLWLLDFFTW